MFPRDFVRRTQSRYYYDKAGRRVHLPYEVKETDNDEDGERDKGGSDNANNAGGISPRSHPGSPRDTFGPFYEGDVFDGTASPCSFGFSSIGINAVGRDPSASFGGRDRGEGRGDSGFGNGIYGSSSSRFASGPFSSEGEDDDDEDLRLCDNNTGVSPRSSFKPSNKCSSNGRRVRFGDGSRPGDNSPFGPGSFRSRQKRFRRSNPGSSIPRSRTKVDGSFPDKPDINDAPHPCSGRRHRSSNKDCSQNKPHNSVVYDEDGAPCCSGGLRGSGKHRSTNPDPIADHFDIPDFPNSPRRHHKSRSSPKPKDIPSPRSPRHSNRRHHHSKHRQHRSPNVWDIPGFGRPSNTSNSRKRRGSHVSEILCSLGLRGTSTVASGKYDSPGSRGHASNAHRERCDGCHRSKPSPFRTRIPRTPDDPRIPPESRKLGTEDWHRSDYDSGSATCICKTCFEGHNRSSRPCVCDACAGKANVSCRPLCECGYHDALCTWVVYCEDPGVSADHLAYGTRLKCRKCPFDIVKVSRESRRAFGMPKVITLHRDK